MPDEAAVADNWVARVKEYEGRLERADVSLNLGQRSDVLKAAGREDGRGRAVRDALWGVSERSFAFWCDMFAWTYNPKVTGRPLPFVLYPFQEAATSKLIDSVEQGYDVVVMKSREMGATWMCLGVMLWQWLFRDGFAGLVASRKEQLVDAADNPDSLFPKLDYLLARIPPWMKPRSKRSAMHLANMDNGSVIDGESTTGDIGRGGRRKVVMLDELAFMENSERVLASTANTTNCRWLVSTPNGEGNAHVRQWRNPNVQKISLHWKDHPVFGVGAYQNADGKWRSPWWEKEFARRGSEREMAQEVDMDILGSGECFFDLPVLEKLLALTAAPVVCGDIMDGRFVSGMGRNRLRCWQPEPKPDRNYVMGIDISLGHGASNSVASIWDVKENAKVAEYVATDVPPHEFADVILKLGRYWHGGLTHALAIWEANGPGIIVGDELRRLKYPHLYWGKQETSPNARRGNVPGWHSSRQSKEWLLSLYRGRLGRGELKNPSRESIEEAMRYTYYPGGDLGPGDMADASSGARTSHGDRVIGDALACLGLRQTPSVHEKPAEIPVGCFEWRRREARRKEREQREPAYA